MKQPSIKSDKKQTPTLGALILIYICGIGLILLFSPSVIFYCSRYETKGILTDFNDSTAKIDFKDYQDLNHSIVVDRKYKNTKIAVGKEVVVYYSKYDSKDFRVPLFEGNETYLVSFILILMAVYAIFISHRGYLKGQIILTIKI